MNIIEILHKVDLAIIRRFNKEKILEMNCLPIKVFNGELLVIKSTKEKLDEKFLTFYLGTTIKWIIVDKEVFQEVVDILYVFENPNMDEILIGKAIEKKVSDIHFEPFNEVVNVRFRINGDLILITILKIDEYRGIISKIKLKSNIDIAKRRNPHDGKMLFQYNGESYDCRVSTIPVVYGEKLVLRILYGSSKFLEIKSLNFSKDDLKEIDKMVQVKNGIVIVNGPTGSGKSTTLYAIISSLNRKIQNIITVEDPVELYIDGINQISIDRSVNLGFAEALRSILRQDPDSIMLGEIRDEETAQMAVRAALTGHKIYATIHTRNPFEVFTRLEDMGIKKYFIKDGVVGIISQRLIKCLCPKCKEKIQETNLKFDLFEARGCRNCNNTGYKGRRVISASYYIDRAIRERLINNDIDKDILSNKPMVKNIFFLLKEGEISYKDYMEFVCGEELQGYEEQFQKEIFI